MRKANLLAVLCLMAFASWGGAQSPTPQGGPTRPVPAYNPSTEVIIKGSVEEVKQPSGMQGTHLSLKTDKESFDVRLGPSSFLADKNFEIAKGDQLEVTGSKIKFAGAEVILAREVKKGNTTLTLRDERGNPKWSRGPRRGMKM